MSRGPKPLNTSYDEELPPEVMERAARTVARNAESEDDLRLLLDMLGIIPPQPGNEVKTPNQYRNELLRANNKRKREEREFQKQIARVRGSQAP